MERIEIEVMIKKDIQTVWQSWTDDRHVVKWNYADDSWHCPYAKNDLVVGGNFSYRMEARDQSEGFDFTGTYTTVLPFKQISYQMSDLRKVDTYFTVLDDSVQIKTIFDPEHENPIELQKMGWQMILDHYKEYVQTL